MITTEQRSKVDKIWLDFHSNGIAIPSDVMEQFNYLVFLKQLDELESSREKMALLIGDVVRQVKIDAYCNLTSN